MAKITTQTTETALRLITETGVLSPASAWAFLQFEFRKWDLAAIIEGADKGEPKATEDFRRMTEFYRPFGEIIAREG